MSDSPKASQPAFNPDDSTISQRLSEVNSRLGSINTRTRLILDRVIGCQPEKDMMEQVTPSCHQEYLQEIEARLSLAERQVSSLEDTI